jgi:hypothetical protein
MLMEIEDGQKRVGRVLDDAFYIHYTLSFRLTASAGASTSFRS